ncbi:MAG: hypothetical protein ACE5NG_09940, partial [bacterium]
MRNLPIQIFSVTSILAVIFISCSKEPGWGGEIETVNGIRVIHNPAQGLWDGHPTKEIIFTEEISLGKLEGEDWELFYQARDVEVDSDGNIYILDSGNCRW